MGRLLCEIVRHLVHVDELLDTEVGLGLHFQLPLKHGLHACQALVDVCERFCRAKAHEVSECVLELGEAQLDTRLDFRKPVSELSESSVYLMSERFVSAVGVVVDCVSDRRDHGM